MRTRLNESEGQMLKTALHAMAERLSWKRSTEKTNAVVDQPAAVPVDERNTSKPVPAGHGRHGGPAHGHLHQRVVSMVGAWRIALYFTGGKHAGENLAAVLKRRARELPAPIQMCDDHHSRGRTRCPFV
jgi:hypothetical protein